MVLYVTTHNETDPVLKEAARSQTNQHSVPSTTSLMSSSQTSQGGGSTPPQGSQSPTSSSARDMHPKDKEKDTALSIPPSGSQ